jgi:hypothetical protein
MKKQYVEFIESKNTRHEWTGISNPVFCDKMFDYQKAIAAWALRKGRAAIFADCGLGKTLMQLEWVQEVML